MNIEQIKTYEEEIRTIGEQQSEVARQYLRSRRKYARFHFKMQMELAKKISEYRAERKSLGIDMSIVMRLSEAQEQNDVAYLKLYQDYLYETANYKGLEMALQALQSKAIGLQSVLKFMKGSEIYEK